MEEEEDIMKILVATDNHLGFMEKDSIRSKDSLETFEEILTIAKEQDVDFILLGGDLFHENKPSRYVLFRTMELLRLFCVGSRPCSIEFRSDPAIHFQPNFPNVNYEDPNYNISMPIFSIHGNHDDPTGDRSLSCNDVLSVCNLINYFGKVSDVENITVSPVLLQKGCTRLALYGIGSIRDERLNQTFRRGNVKFLRPKEEKKNWFSLLVLHQNRTKHTGNNFIPSTYLPTFLDLVVWGHEHESHRGPEYQSVSDVLNVCADDDDDDDDESDRNGFYIYQPGSSVATSLSEGEVAPKHVGLLYIKGTEFKIETIQLKTVRPFVMDTVVLAHTDIDPADSGAILSYLTEKVKSLIEMAAVENPESKKIPIVRLRVDYSDGYEIENQARFCQYFVDKVANPKTILNWFRRKQQSTLSRQNNANFNDPADIQGANNDEGGEHQTIASLLRDSLQRDRLDVLSEKNLVEAVNEFVEKNEKDAISDFVKYSLQQTQEFLQSEDFPESEFDEQLELKREEIMKRQEQSSSEQVALIRIARPNTREEGLSDESNNEDETPMEVVPSGSRGRGRGRGRGGRGKGGAATGSTRGRGGGRGSRSKGAAAATPRLTLSGTSTTTQTTTTKRTSSKRTPKAPVVFQDDSDDDLIPKKKSKNATATVDSSDEEDFNPFAF